MSHKCALCTDFAIRTDREGFEKDVIEHIRNTHTSTYDKLTSVQGSLNPAFLVQIFFKKEDTENTESIQIENAKSKNKVKCDDCNKIFSRPWCLKQHMKNMHIPRVDCIFCTKQVDPEPHKLMLKTCDACAFVHCSLKEMMSHKILHSGNVNYRCNLCQSNFDTRSLLRKHESEHLGETIKPFSCIRRFCKNTFRTEDGAKQCEKRQRKVHVCKICGRSFVTPAELNRHKPLHKIRSGLLQCQKSGKSYFSVP